MNTLIIIESQVYTNVLEKITSTCRNYIHHSATSDYVRHQTRTQTLADHMQLPSRTLDSDLILGKVSECIFSTNGGLF